ncbi:MAG TPA: RNA polymerase sigma factor [Myxococcota bacterium]|nr:RNA polymerase sigma factor [Myxococcota bacterium]
MDQIRDVEELYRRYHGRVIAFARKRLADATEAEDVAQDVFLQVHRSIDRYEGRSSVLTWIFGIAHHEVCDRFRRRAPEPVPLDGAADEIAAAEPPPDRVIDASRALHRCGVTLARRASSAQYRIFAMRYAESRSIEAIARDTGRTSPAVRIALLRARRAIASATPDLEDLLAT